MSGSIHTPVIRGTDAANAVVAIVEEIGRDRALTPGELSRASRAAGVPLRNCWTAYERHWARFCGARLDPQFWRLTHPAAWCGLPAVTDGAPVVIVGTGPSLAEELPQLQRLRPHVRIFTSPRGADALAEAGIDADLVLIEHHTPLDAHFSVQALTQRPQPWRDRVPLVATDERTPPALLGGIAPDRVIVLRPLPTWGQWPATAAATALLSGTSTVALMGIDLGTPTVLDARQRPLADLLALLAAGSSARCVDVGRAGAPKPGWTRSSLADIVGEGPAAPLAATRVPWAPAADRVLNATAAWHRLLPFVDRARAALDAAIGVRDGRRTDEHCHSMTRGLEDLLDGGSDPQVRDDVQNSLGCAFLPRYWRTPPEQSLGVLLWRPLALSAHELVEQHRALGLQLQKLRGRP